MNDDNAPRDEAAEKELDGVPKEYFEGDDPVEKDEVQDDLSGALEQLRGDLDGARQDVLYARAEAQNARRRSEKDVADARNYAVTGFARDILSVADNLARAVEAIPAELREDDKMKPLVAGIEATRRELDKVFDQHGIKRIAAVGLPLDPNQHQAMLEVPSADQEPGTIVQEMQAGYMLRERLLRPAMVGVAKKPD